MTDNLERAKYNLSATAYAAALDEIERLTVPDNTVPWVATLFAQMAEVRAEKDAASPNVNGSAGCSATSLSS